MNLKVIQKKEEKTCGKCVHVGVCIVHFGLIEILIFEETPISGLDKIFIATALSCDLYEEEKEGENEIDDCRSTPS